MNNDHNLNCLADLQKAGTMRSAELRPQLAASLFPTPTPRMELDAARSKYPDMSLSRRRSRNETHADTDDLGKFDEFGDDVLHDEELMAASTSPPAYLPLSMTLRS